MNSKEIIFKTIEISELKNISNHTAIDDEKLIHKYAPEWLLENWRKNRYMKSIEIFPEGVNGLYIQNGRLIGLFEK